jgi:hypothetical protein
MFPKKIASVDFGLFSSVRCLCSREKWVSALHNHATFFAGILCYLKWNCTCVKDAMYFILRFFFDLFLPAGSIVFHEMGVRSFMKFVLHVYMLKNISREVTCQENAFYWTESGTLWDESACWKVCSCQLFVYSRKNVTLIFIIL